MTKSVLPPRGTPISQLVDDDTRQQLEALRDRLADQSRREALERPRDEGGLFTRVSPDQLVKDNATLRRMKDVTAAAGDMTVGRLLDLAQVPSVTQLTKRYGTAASRAPLLGMLAGQRLGPQEAMLLGTTPRLGTGGALVVWRPQPLVPVSPPPARPEPAAAAAQAEPLRLTAAEAPLRLTYTPAADEAGQAEDTAGPAKAQGGWWASVKEFGRTLMGRAKDTWQKLKTHPLVAPVLSWFAGFGFGPAHASMYGANPPSGARPGAPLTPQAPAVQPRLTGPEERAALPAPPVQPRLTGPERLAALPAPEAQARLTAPEEAAALPAPPVQPRLTGPEARAALPTPEPQPRLPSPARPAALGAPEPQPRLTSPARPAPAVVAAKVTEATFGDAVAALRAAWPKGVDAAPATFTRQAEALQAFKLEGLEALGAEPAPKAVSSLLARADAMHGKAGHSANVGRLTDAFFGDRGVQEVLQRARAYGPKLVNQVSAAAPWLSLGDLEAPVSILAAPRRLSAEERAEHIAPRGERAAALFERLNLGGPGTAALLAGIGDPGSDSLAQELVRLLEDTAALAAKPFCRGDAGVNAGLLGEKLAGNAARGAYQPELAEIMADLARRGVVDAAVKAPRADDLFIA